MFTDNGENILYNSVDPFYRYINYHFGIISFSWNTSEEGLKMDQPEPINNSKYT